MSTTLLALVSILYIGSGISFYLNSQMGMSIAFTMYAISNIGLIMAAKGI